MLFPDLTALPTSRQTIDVFRGYCHRERIAAGEFYEMENLTSDHYPALAPRPGREVAPGVSPQGLIAKDSLCYVQGTDFVMNGYHVNLGLTQGAKQLTSMGAYVIILPDKKWINTLNLTEFGSIDAVFQSPAPVQLSLCSLEGAEYTGYPLGDSPPEEPAGGELWMDTSQRPHVLKSYSAQLESWTAVTATYIKLSCPGIGAAFSQYDGVQISGPENLSGNFVIWGRGEDYLLVPGVLDEPQEEAAVTVRRQMPEVDFLVESGNRLWGCRYGLSAQGQVVNEIYASKLGDFKNWSCYMGASTDSFTAACGTDGPFTGAVSYLGNPLFFKETCLHKVYGSYPASFQIQTTSLRGVERGSEQSLVQLGETLYYKSSAGICAYDGSLPRLISQALGSAAYSQAAAGATGEKLYVSMVDEENAWHLFVFDPEKGLWHREDSLEAEQFCFCRGSLYAISQGRLLSLLEGQETVSWMAVTGELGLTDPDSRYLTRLTLRMDLPPGAEIRISVRYDDGAGYESLAFLRGYGQRGLSLPLPVRRCRHLRLKLEGKGDIRLYSLTQTLTEGGEQI